VEVDAVETVSFEHTVQCAEATTAGSCDILAAVGGDGTANAVANGLFHRPKDRRPAMGIIPCGRGNDFAAYLGIGDLETACTAILAGRRRRVDVGTTDAGIFLGVAGAGFDSKVARRAQKQVPLLSGAAAYVYAVLRTLSDFRPLPAKVTYDHGVYEGLITFAVAGNTDRYGGGMRITPRASMEDGLLDLCVAKDVSRVTLLRVFPRVFSGTHLDHPSVFYTKTKSVTIESPEAVELFADGEFLQTIPARIDLVPGALGVIVPPVDSARRSTK
jgi:YegS/Rv2252/BmrU family lipid kinase